VTDGDCGYHEDWPLAYCKCCRDEAVAQAKAEGAAEEREAILKELQVMSCGCSHKVRARGGKP
jgi:hypothetical protein